MGRGPRRDADRLTRWADGDPIAGAVACAAIGLVPPLLLLGMVPSLLIRLAASDAAGVGDVAGRVYALSSCGGVVAALAVGLVVVPALGLARPTVAVALLLLLPSLGVLLLRRRIWAVASLLVLPIALRDLAQRAAPASGDVRVQYYAEGLLGQVLVADQPLPGGAPGGFYRMLYLNRMGQTVMDGRTGRPLSTDYIGQMLPFAATRPRGARVLLLGLGGGSLVKELVRLGFAVDGVELDPRIIEAADRYFLADTPKGGVRYVADDARRVLRTTGERYDVVIFDVFRGERPPAHVFTRESLEEVRRLIPDDGLVLLNLVGRLHGPHGDGIRAVLRALQDVGGHA